MNARVVDLRAWRRFEALIADAESAQDDLNAYLYDTDVRGPGKLYGMRHGWSFENDMRLTTHYGNPLRDAADLTAARAFWAASRLTVAA